LETRLRHYEQRSERFLNYHDYRLQGYEVADLGCTVTLNLVYDYAGEALQTSRIRFTQVVLYDFEHPAGAIITDIEEASIAEIMGELSSRIVEWARLYGLRGWRTDVDQYEQWLLSENKKAWRIGSAIGFYGVVIAGAVEQIPN
jgi:hypothetical protein